MAAADPDQWLKDHPEPREMDPGAWQAGQSAARQVLRNRIADAAGDIGDALALGEIKSESDVEYYAAGRLGPEALKKAKDDLMTAQTEKWRAENLSEKGVVKNFGILLGEVEKYDREKDKDGAGYAQLVWRIRGTMPEELRGELTGPLAKKWNPADAPEAPAPVKSFINETLANWYRDGKFGKTTRVEMIRPDDPNYDRDLDPWNQSKEKVVVPEWRDKAAAARGQAELELQRWLKANPGATIVEAQEQLEKTAGVVRKSLSNGERLSMMRQLEREVPAWRDAAAAKRGQAQLEMNQWLKANPNATLKEAKDQLLRSGGAALLPNDVDRLLRKQPPAPAPGDVSARLKEMERRLKPKPTPEPPANAGDFDLPAGDGEINPSLLPFTE